MRVAFGEWTPDNPDIDAPLSDVENAVPYAQHYRQMRALATSGSALPAAPVAAMSTSLVAGSTDTYAATFDKIYRRDPATLAWADVTGAAITPETPMYWGLVQSGNYVLAASINNLLRQRLIGAGGGNFAAITNGPRARVLGTVREFVVAGDINDPTDGLVPQRVRWNAIGDPLTWPLPGTPTAQSLQADEQDLKAEFGPVRGIFGSDIGLILQERAVTRMTYVGAPLIFKFDTVDATRGLAAPNAAAQIGRVVFFLADDGFFVTDGSGDSQSIGDGKVDKWFADNANPSYISSVRAFVLPRDKCVAWSFVSRSANVNDSLLIYNFNSKRWSRAKASTSLVLQARTSGYTLDQLDAFGTLETLAASFDAAVWLGGATYPAAFDLDYKLGDFSGEPLSATFETGALTLDGMRSIILGVRPLTQGGTATITLGEQRTLADAVTWGAERGLTYATGQADFRQSSFFHRVRMRVAGGFDKAIGVDAMALAEDGNR